MKAGLHLEFPAADYFRDPCPTASLTQSLAKLIVEHSPLHAWMESPRLNKDYAGDAGEKYERPKAIGNAAHALMLGRGKEIAIIKADDFRSKAAQEKRDEAIDAGLTAVLERHHEEAVQMVEAARKQLAVIPGCKGAFVEGHGEVVVAAQQDGLWYRSMIDWMQDKTLFWDLKTHGAVAPPHLVNRKMVADGWDVQASMQEFILDIIDPDNAGRRKFRFVAVENEPPYALTVVELSESVMTFGRKKLQHAIGVWSHCMNTGHWPAYPPEIITPDYPQYAETSWLNREIAEYERAPAKSERLPSLMGG
jgi:hypothetical protein